MPYGQTHQGRADRLDKGSGQLARCQRMAMARDECVTADTNQLCTCTWAASGRLLGCSGSAALLTSIAAAQGFAVDARASVSESSVPVRCSYSQRRQQPQCAAASQCQSCARCDYIRQRAVFTDNTSTSAYTIASANRSSPYRTLLLFTFSIVVTHQRALTRGIGSVSHSCRQLKLRQRHERDCPSERYRATQVLSLQSMITTWLAGDTVLRLSD